MGKHVDHSFNPSAFNHLYEGYTDYFSHKKIYRLHAISHKHKKKSNFKWLFIIKLSLHTIIIRLQSVFKWVNRFILSSLQYTGMMWMHYHTMNDYHEPPQPKGDMDKNKLNI